MVTRLLSYTEQGASTRDAGRLQLNTQRTGAPQQRVPQFQRTDFWEGFRVCEKTPTVEVQSITVSPNACAKIAACFKTGSGRVFRGGTRSKAAICDRRESPIIIRKTSAGYLLERGANVAFRGSESRLLESQWHGSARVQDFVCTCLHQPEQDR